jgi:hypothetical protein
MKMTTKFNRNNLIICLKFWLICFFKEMLTHHILRDFFLILDLLLLISLSEQLIRRPRNQMFGKKSETVTMTIQMHIVEINITLYISEVNVQNKMIIVLIYREQ